MAQRGFKLSVEHGGRQAGRARILLTFDRADAVSEGGGQMTYRQQRVVRC